MRSPPQQFQIWRNANRLPVIARSDSSAVAHRAKAEATKQSISRRKGGAKEEWIASSQELLAMTLTGTSPRSRGARRPEFCGSFRPLKTEGAGKAGCALHPRSRVQLLLGKTHTSIQVQRRQSG